MNRDKIKDADLVINHPTGPRPQNLGCDDVLEELLDSDQTLRVHWRVANEWRSRIYKGKP
ncbi:hypothetical protein Apa02nite_056180 [Actinoplanes palleronii]|uniref:Uncharacterized protein n=2 Tax=Actinoplanes palleronii TaxID=113570 RepID=A0ABQ4BFY8_9ACTN|nr:hypothetical protein Apa02nite_056180 [Actinoplanes palleronii]